MAIHSSTDQYKVLGVPATATPELIKQAYRKLAKRFHPDIDPSPQAAARFMAVHKAYETLRDPLMRLAYDAHCRTQAPHCYRPQRPAAPQRTMGDQAVHTDPARDMRVRSYAFVGLHLTGLVFGLTLFTGLLVGILFAHWPWGGLFFSIPGLLVIPDAWKGILMWKRKGAA